MILLTMLVSTNIMAGESKRHYEMVVYTGYTTNVPLRKQVIHYDLLSECNRMHAELLHVFEVATEEDDSFYYVIYECVEIQDVE